MQFTLDNGKTNELLNDIAGNMPNGRLKNKLIENSPLSDTVITSLLIEYPLSHGNFKNVMQINMPVSQNVEPYLFERLSTIPTGISRQLTPLQAHNPNARTLTSIKDDIEFWEMEKQLFTNDLLINLTDTINNNIAVAKELLEYENTLSSKQLLYNTYVQELDTTSASSIFNEITLEYPNNDWISLQEIFKSLEAQEKTFYDMDSIQLSFVRELAYKCPADHASFSAQAVLHYLFEEEVPECEIMTTRKKTSLVKDVVFATPEDEAYIEDNFPDPFTGKTTVNYYLPNEMQGKVIVYDMFGRLVEQFILETGEKSLEMNLEHLVPGVYTYSFVVDDKQIDVKKMIITQ